MHAQAKRVHRLKVNVAAWIAGTAVVTALWVAAEWQANGVFERFGHEGNPGEWNPTLWAVVVGLWGLVVGIMALRVHLGGSREPMGPPCGGPITPFRGGRAARARSTVGGWW